MKLEDSPYKSFQLKISKKSVKFIEDLPKPERIPLISKIDKLIDKNYKTLDIKKLQGFTNLYRIKSSDYRIIFMTPNRRKNNFYCFNSA